MPGQAGGKSYPKIVKHRPLKAGLFVTIAIIGLITLIGVYVSNRLDPDIVGKPLPASIVCRDSRVGSKFIIPVKEYHEVPLSEIPRIVQDAFLSVYESRVFTNKRIKAKADFEAVTGISLLRPSITMTLAHDALAVHLGEMPLMIEEIILAAKIRRHYGREERLQLFLNRLYFGSGVFGVEGAAHRFFGKSVSQLELHEVALLVGQSHERLDSWTLPRASQLTNPIPALMRRDAVLDVMAECGIIADKQAMDAKQKPLEWLEH